MAIKQGICKNFDNCPLADEEIVQEVDSSEFKCTECGKPLCEIDDKKHNPHPPRSKWVIIAIAVLIIAGLAVGGFFLFNREKPQPTIPKIHITVIPSDNIMGTATGGGDYDSLAKIRIEAFANEGFRFVKWDDENTEKQREVVALEDKIYTAVFERIPVAPSNSPAPEETKKVTITVRSEDENKGLVSGGGTFNTLASISIGAIPKEGYKFDKWDDGNIDNPREVITGSDKTFIAYFVKDSNKKDEKKGGGGEVPTKCTKQYSFGKYVGNCKNGIPEGDGTMYYNCRVQIAKHDTDNPPHYAETGDRFVGTWGNGDIVSGALYSKDGKIKEKIFAPKRFNPYDLNSDK